MNLVFYASLFLYILSLSLISCGVDFDFWARLIVGKTFFQTGALLNYDFQSFGPTRPWIDHEWGSSLVFYAIQSKFGDFGLIIFKVLIIFAIYFTVVKIIQLRRKHNKGTSAPFNILFFIFLIQATFETVFNIRCQLFTFFFFILWLYALEKSRLEENLRILWTLPLTFIIWLNMHGGCVTGLGLVFMYGVGEFLNKKPCKQYFITLFACLIMFFINPYGPKYILFLFDALTLKRSNITEWQPIYSSIHIGHFLKYKIWSTIIAFISGLYLIKKGVKGKIYKNLDKTKALVLISLFILSYKTLRLIPFFAFVAASFLYDDIYKVLNKELPDFLQKGKEILIFVVILISAIYTVKVYDFNLSMREYPVSEAEFLKINNLKGNLLANFHYGSFLSYKLYPNNFIFMDGRYEESYEPGLIDELKEIYIGDNWKETLAKYHIDYIIIEKSYKIFDRLKGDEGWYMPIQSKNFALFINRDIKPKKFKKPPEDLKYYNKIKWETGINWR